MKKFLFGIFGLLFAVPAVAATLPAGYTELEYIEFTGTQYIDTGFIPNQNAEIRTKFYPTDYKRWVYGTGNANPRISSYIAQQNSTGNQRWGFATYSTGPFVNTMCTVVHNKNGWMLNGELHAYDNVTDFTALNSLSIGVGTGDTTDAPFQGKMYYFQIYDNGNLVRDFVPAKNSSGVVGMYDTVSGAFFTNAGTGTFTGGPVACPGGTLQTYTSAKGTVVQNGTPTPTNPIEPVFYQQGDMVLRKVGDIEDSYDATTGKITRRVGVKVLNGTENWRAHTTNGVFYVEAFFPYDIPEQAIKPVSTHYTGVPRTTPISNMPNKSIKTGTSSGPKIVLIKDTSIADVNSLISFLSQNLVTVWYPLPESNYYTEDWAAEQCTSSSPIKIATTAYNSARFSPVVTELNDTIATIRSVVTNTINQTKAIADSQATKQTRPDETCPAGKKCLLVEDDAGQPHWYEIIESPEVQ